MADRVNEGYTITDSIHVGNAEFVIGKSSSAPAMYVTWECKGGDYYFWGHYFTDPLEAKKDFLARAGEELEYLMTRQSRSDKNAKGKEAKEHER